MSEAYEIPKRRAQSARKSKTKQMFDINNILSGKFYFLLK